MRYAIPLAVAVVPLALHVYPAALPAQSQSLGGQSAAHVTQAIAFYGQGRWEQALEECTAAIRLAPRSPTAYRCRGAAWLAKGDLDEAIRDYTIAIRLNPRDAYAAYTGRGVAWRRKGQYSRAVADYHRAIRLNPVHGADAFNALAWLQATCPEDSQRNGREAVANAKIACKEAEWSNANFLGTLAAAYAEAQDFSEAAKWQQEALQIAADNYDRENAEKRLQSYRSNQPHREQPPPLTTTAPAGAQASQ